MRKSVVLLALVLSLFFQLYGYSATASDQDDNYEENDTFSTAFDLSDLERRWVRSLQHVNGLGIQADDDWYMIHITSDETVLIELQFSHSEGDIDVALYDALGNLLAISGGISDHEYIEYTALESGIHYISVYNIEYPRGNSYNLWWGNPHVHVGDYDGDSDVDGADLVNLVLDFIEGFANYYDVADFSFNFGKH